MLLTLLNPKLISFQCKLSVVSLKRNGNIRGHWKGRLTQVYQ